MIQQKLFGWDVENLHSLCSNKSVILDALRLSGKPRQTRKIYIQDEHTLVLPGGRDLPHTAQWGEVLSKGGNSKYRVRLSNLEKAITADCIIDYAIPNIINIRNSLLGNSISNKIFYAPSIPPAYDLCSHVTRSSDIVTNFNDPSQPRRARMLALLSNMRLPIKNKTGISGDEANYRMYAETKVLINIHQTDHHHTVEEFRILPALAQGCIVISEWSPLISYLPYAPFVIWSNIDEIPLIASEVLSRYSYYYDKLHGDGTLRQYLQWFRQKAVQLLARKLRDFL
jgi:hypothetical protein